MINVTEIKSPTTKDKLLLFFMVLVLCGGIFEVGYQWGFHRGEETRRGVQDIICSDECFKLLLDHLPPPRQCPAPMPERHGSYDETTGWPVIKK